MKNLFFLIAISAGVFAVQSCNSGTKNAKEIADSMNKAKEHVTATNGIGVEPVDAEFATKAAVGGMAEVEMGKLAEAKTTNTQLRDFAKMMVVDHGKANEELMSIAKRKNITLPIALDDEHQKKVDELNKKFGKDFDKDYIETMVDGHKKTLKLMQDESKDGKDPDVKAFASKTVPIVQSHLEMINKINDSMK